MQILLAPDSFKGSLSAIEVSSIMREAIIDYDSKAQVIMKPMADGGEGTLDAYLSSIHGKRVEIDCVNGLGEQMRMQYVILDNGTAVIEVASVIGLTQVPEDKRNPDNLTSFGLGEIILHALDQGIESFIIGLGGSATNDAGFGMLQALGMQAYDVNGEPLSYFGKDLLALQKIDLNKLDPRLSNVNFQIACDVDNPLTGPDGASKIFAPQKGATFKQVEAYDQAHDYFAQLVNPKWITAPGAGAAGGLGYAFLMMGGRLTPGAALIADVTQVEEAVQAADIIITGEGKSDHQTLHGKAPSYVAKLAHRYQKPVILISASIADDSKALNKLFTSYFSIIDQPRSLASSINNVKVLLYQQTQQIIRLIGACHHPK